MGSNRHKRHKHWKHGFWRRDSAPNVQQDDGIVFDTGGPGPPLLPVANVPGAPVASPASAVSSPATASVSTAVPNQSTSSSLSSQQQTTVQDTTQAALSSVLVGPSGPGTLQQIFSQVSGNSSMQPSSTSAVSAASSSAMNTSSSSSSAPGKTAVVSRLTSEPSSSVAGFPVVGSPGATSISLSVATTASSGRPIATNVANVAGAESHSTQFYIGIAFGVIAGCAVILAFIAWLVRTTSRRTDKKKRDLENRDLGYGLGFFLDPAIQENPPKIPMPQIPEMTMAGRRDMKSISESNPFADPPCAPQNPFGLRPLPMNRPAAIHLRSTDSAERQVLGPLHVKNLAPGDMSSSSSFESLRNNSASNNPCDQAPAMNMSPRYLTVRDQGLSVPWAQTGTSAVNPPPQVQGFPTTNSLSAVSDSDGHWNDHPPLPSPDFHLSRNAAAEDGSAEGWGASIRNGLFSAISVVTKSRSSNLDTFNGDKYTSFPSHPSFRYGPRRSSVCMRSESRVPIDDDEPQLPQPTLPRVQFDPYSESNETLGEEINRVISLGATQPLVLTKKSTVKRDIPSATPLPQSSSDVGIISRDCSNGSYERDSGGGRKLSVKNPDVPFIAERPRAVSLERGYTKSSTSTLDSESSDMSTELSDEELLAKRMLVLRAKGRGDNLISAKSSPWPGPAVMKQNEHPSTSV